MSGHAFTAPFQCRDMQLLQSGCFDIERGGCWIAVLHGHVPALKGAGKWATARPDIERGPECSENHREMTKIGPATRCPDIERGADGSENPWKMTKTRPATTCPDIERRPECSKNHGKITKTGPTILSDNAKGRQNNRKWWQNTGDGRKPTRIEPPTTDPFACWFSSFDRGFRPFQVRPRMQNSSFW